MPAGARLKAKEATLTGDDIGGMILPGATVYLRRHKGLNHFAVSNNRFTRLDAKRHALRPQAAAAFTLVDFGVHVQRGEERIKRTG